MFARFLRGSILCESLKNTYTESSSTQCKAVSPSMSAIRAIKHVVVLGPQVSYQSGGHQPSLAIVAHMSRAHVLQQNEVVTLHSKEK